MNEYEKSKKKDERQAKAEVRQLNEDYRAVFETRHGIRVLNDLLGMCGIYTNSFTGNSTTFFNEGKRDIGLRILEKVMQSDKTIYINALKELNKLG